MGWPIVWVLGGHGGQAWWWAVLGHPSTLVIQMGDGPSSFLEISLPSIILEPRMGANIVVGFYDEMGRAWGLDGTEGRSGLVERVGQTCLWRCCCSSDWNVWRYINAVIRQYRTQILQKCKPTFQHTTRNIRVMFFIV